MQTSAIQFPWNMNVRSANSPSEIPYKWKNVAIGFVKPASTKLKEGNKYMGGYARGLHQAKYIKRLGSKFGAL